MKILYLLANWHRLGHIFMEPMIYSHIHEGDEITFLIPEAAPANTAAADIVTRHFKIATVPNFNQLYATCADAPVMMGEFLLDRWRNSNYIPYYTRQRTAPDSMRYYSFSKDEIRTGLQIERDLGIPHDKPLVCLHSREAGYVAHLDYHRYRDATVGNFAPAIDFLLERGFTVVRIGDPTMTPLPPRPGLHDIAVVQDKHPLSDIWFCARARFMVGTTSGPLNIPLHFNEPPVLLVNVIPYQPSILTRNSRFLPKLLFSRKLGRTLSMREVKLANFEFCLAKSYEENELDVLENSTDEIFDAVREMVADLEGGDEHLRTHPLQQQYTKALRAVDDFKRVTGQEYLVLQENRVATSFLEKHPGYVD